MKRINKLIISIILCIPLLIPTTVIHAEDNPKQITYIEYVDALQNEASKLGMSLTFEPNNDQMALLL